MVRPNCLKYWPAMPPMKLTGANTATMVSVIAITARPISPEASMAAWRAVLPMRMWRTMFSTSTMASSTRMPVTRVIASRLTKLKLKPIASIARKVGTTASGSAVAETRVARQSRRNTSTTSTASAAPSSRACMAARKLP